MRSLHDDPQTHAARSIQRSRRVNESGEDEHDEVEAVADKPHPEEWLPQIMDEIGQDILRVLEAMETAYPDNSDM